jgi:TonB family protein
MRVMQRIAKFAACLVLCSSLLHAAGAERKIVVRVDPEYPAIARKMQLHGAVKLKVWIRADGAVTRVEYVGGHPLLAESAVNALRKWKFEAAPQDTTMQLELKFSPPESMDH